MYVLGQKQWSQQPAIAARVSAEWLARGVVSVLVPFGESLYDIAQRRFIKRNSGGTAPNARAQNGFGVASDFGTSYWEVLGTNFGGTEYTVITVASDVILVGSTYNLAALDDTGSNRCFQNRINSSNQFQFIPFNTAGSTFAATSSITLGTAENQKGWIQLVTVYGLSASIWKNGVKVGSSTLTGTPKGPTLNVCINARDAAGTDPASAAFNLVVIMKRGVSDGDAQRLSTNPWQVIAPLQRQIIAGPPTTSSTLHTATLDAAIQTARSATATLNGVIQTSGSSTATLDGVIRQAMSASTTLNAAIQAAMSASGTLDAVITTGAATAHTVTLNAAIQEAKSLTATLNAVIQTSGSASATLNAVIVQANSSTATLDATIQAAVTVFALLDAYIFDADAPVVETTTVQAAGRGRRRRYIMPDDSVVIATPSEAEQLVKLFVKPVPPKKPPKRTVKALRKLDLVEIQPVSSDTVPTERITVKKKAVWEKTDLYDRTIEMLAQREILRRRREEELLLLS